MNRLYNDLAHLWPIVSPPEEYEEEAAYWRDALRAELGPSRHKVLELGVGGGHNLSHLTKDFDATAVDLSPRMLENSKKLNPGVEHHVGDMRTVRLGRTFDAVLIHDAIMYMLSDDDLLAAFTTAVAHLKPGGLFVTAPDNYKEDFSTQLDHFIRRDHNPEMVFIDVYMDPDPNDTTFNGIFFYIWPEGTGLRVEQDHHVFGLFPKATWLKLIREAGFEVSERPYDVYQGAREGSLLVGRLRR